MKLISLGMARIGWRQCWLSSLMIAGALASPLAAQTPPAYTVNEAVRLNVLAAQTAIGQSNYAAAASALAQAQAAAQTDGDRYVIAATRLEVANRSFDQNEQRAAISALITSPLIDEAYRAELYFHLARHSFNAQEMEPTREALTQSVERGSTDPRTYIALADIYSQMNAHARALELFDRAAQLQQASNQPISAFWYRRAIDIAQRAGNPERMAQLNQALLAAYPDGRNWRDVALVYRTSGALDPQQSLDIMRLVSAVGGLVGERDYLDYAQLAAAAEQPSEVERAVAAGRAANIIAPDNAEIAEVDRGTTRAAQAMRDAIGGRAAAAANAATGADALAVADDYMGLGQYAEAAQLYRTALTKGGVDADLANLRLGMALALSGDAVAARAALAAASGRQAWLARFWTIYVDNRIVAPAPSPVPTVG